MFSFSNKNDILTPQGVELHNQRNLIRLFDQAQLAS